MHQLHAFCCRAVSRRSRAARAMDWSACAGALTMPAGAIRGAARQACTLIAANIPVFLAHSFEESAAAPPTSVRIALARGVGAHWWSFRAGRDPYMIQLMVQARSRFRRGQEGTDLVAMRVWRCAVSLHVMSEEPDKGHAGRLLVDMLVANARLRFAGCAGAAMTVPLTRAWRKHALPTRRLTIDKRSQRRACPP